MGGTNDRTREDDQTVKTDKERLAHIAHGADEDTQYVLDLLADTRRQLMTLRTSKGGTTVVDLIKEVEHDIQFYQQQANSGAVQQLELVRSWLVSKL